MRAKGGKIIDSWMKGGHKKTETRGDDERAFIVPALDARSQFHSIKDRRNVV